MSTRSGGKYIDYLEHVYLPVPRRRDRIRAERARYRPWLIVNLVAESGCPLGPAKVAHSEPSRWSALSELLRAS